MTLLAWSSAHSLWFSSEASWDRMSFGMLLVYVSFALIFLGLAVGLSYYAKKGFRSYQSPSTRKVLAIGLLIISGLMAWFIGIAYLSRFADKQVNLSRTAETPAEIVSESSYTSGGKKLRTTYTIKYTYTVDNRAYEAVSRFYKPLKSGGKVKACYNPVNPQSSQIRDADYQCGQDSSD